MSLAWQRFLCLTCVLVASVYAAIGIANDEYQIATVCGAIALAVSAYRFMNLPTDATLVGLILIGYIAGNRGFAQQFLLAGFPLLPAEFALGVGGIWLLAKSSMERRLPWRHDTLNHLILAGMVLGAARLAFDFPRYHLLAMRDYATFYYAGFFFLAQRYAENDRIRRYLQACLTTAFLLLPVLLLLTQAFPKFFLTAFTRNGTPLVFLKGDVAIPIMAASVFYFALFPGRKTTWISRLVSLTLFLGTFASNSRAAIASLFVVDIGLGLCRRFRIPLSHLATLLAAGLTLMVVAYGTNNRWAQNQVFAVVERIGSVADFEGTQHHKSGLTDDKADNNKFRLVWWRTVAEETLASNPAFGLGFGSDLSSRFIKNYDYEMGEDFTARSPHSIIFTLLGRTGLAGLAFLAALVANIASQTWRSWNSNDTEAWRYWCMAWVIMVSACLGVVLEGPMGAIPFWIILGLAHHESSRLIDDAAAPRPVPPSTAPLQDGGGRV